MTQVIQRAQSSFTPKIELFASQPVNIASNSTEILPIGQKKDTPPIKFQKLNVSDDFTNEYINETDFVIDTTNEISKSKKDSSSFDEICEIDQISILPFFPITFDRQ